MNIGDFIQLKYEALTCPPVNNSNYNGIILETFVDGWLRVLWDNGITSKIHEKDVKIISESR